MDTAADTALGRLSINNDGWNALDAVPFGFLRGFLVMHIEDLNVARTAGYFVDKRNGFLAHLATRRENLNCSFLTHNETSFTASNDRGCLKSGNRSRGRNQNRRS